MIIASAFPDVQPGRLTISCTTETRLGVRWSVPPSSAVFHVAGVHETDAVVFVLEEMLFAEAAKVGALSLACAWMVKFVVSEPAAFAVNWIQAFWMIAPCGRLIFAKRIPIF